MREAASWILGSLLVLGSAFPGPGHVHAISDHGEAAGLHVDHVHHGDDHTHLAGASPVPEIAGDHAGHDAVPLGLTGVQVTPKRTLPFLASSSVAMEAPEGLTAVDLERPGTGPRAPPDVALPPGRAPPA